jgi:RecB family exonuclease
VPLRLVTGSANAGKTGFVFRALIDAAPTSAPVLVVPTTADARSATEELASRGRHGVRVAVLDAWIAELWGLYGDGRRVVPEGARRALVRRAILDAELGQLEASGRTRGFSEVMAAVVRGTVDPVRPIGDTAEEVARSLVAYEALLEREGLIEHACAATLLGESPPPVVGPVGVNRFSDLTSGQERFLLGLSSELDVIMTFAWEEGSPATLNVDPLVKRLTDAGAVLTQACESAFTDPGLERLTTALYRGGETQQPPDSLTLAGVPSAEGECAVIAALAKEALVLGHSVAVTFKNPAGRADQLAAAFSALGVDYVPDCVTPLGQTPFGRALMALLDACAGGGEKSERMAAFLLSPFSGADYSVASELDRRWRHRRSSSTEVRRDVAGIGNEMARVVKAAEVVTAGILDKTALQEWQILADTLLIRSLERVGWSSSYAREAAAAHRTTLAAVSEMAAFSHLNVTQEEMREALDRASVIVSGRAAPGSVLVTEAERIRGRRFDTVIIGGLTASEFSTQGSRSLAVQLLEDLGQPVGADEQAKQRALFHAVATRARSRLVLTWRTSDDKGDLTRRSTHLEEVLDVFRTPGDGHDDIPAGLDVRTAGSCDNGDGATQRHVKPPRGVIADPRFLDHMRAREEFSVSEIELYTSCPYRWYYSRVISPDSMDTEFDAREKGTAAHALLAAFYGAWNEAGPRRVGRDTLAQALDTLDRIARESQERLSLGVRGVAEELALSEVRSWVRATVCADVEILPEFVPVAHELRFGRAHDAPVEARGVSLRGSVDRVDLSPRGGLVVTDYKSSSSVSGEGSFVTKGLLQAPLYLEVASQHLGEEPLGCLYRSLKTGAVRGAWRSDRVLPAHGWSSRDARGEAEIKAMLTQAHDAMERAVEGMRDGRIVPAPLSSESCKYCGARTFCREVRR